MDKRVAAVVAAAAAAAVAVAAVAWDCGGREGVDTVGAARCLLTPVTAALVAVAPKPP